MRKIIIALSISLCFFKLQANENNTPTLQHKKLTHEEMETLCGKKLQPIDESWFHGHFSLTAERFPPNHKYKLYCKNLNQKTMYMGSCLTDQTGKMWIRLKNDKKATDFSNHILSLGNFLPGEPIEYTLIDQDKKTHTHILLPNPLQVTDKQGRKLSMRILTPDCKSFAFQLTNFTPNEQIKVVSMSRDEVISNDQYVNKNGTLTCLIQPAVVGKKRGQAIFKVIPLTTGETMKLNYTWGEIK